MGLQVGGHLGLKLIGEPDAQDNSGKGCHFSDESTKNTLDNEEDHHRDDNDIEDIHAGFLSEL